MSETNQPGNTGTGTGNPAGDGKPDTTQFDPSNFVSKKDFDGTAAQIRRMNETITQLSQRKSLSLDDLVTAGLLELDDEGKPKARTQQAPDPKGNKGGSGDQLDDSHPVMKRMKALEKQLADKDAAAAKAAEETAKLERKQAVVSALQKSNALNADRDYIHLADKVTKNDAGAYVVKTKDQYGSDVETPLDAYMPEFTKGNPELFKTTAQPGSGAPRGAQQSGGGASSGGKVIPYDQWKDMQFVADNHAKFTSGEYVRGPKPGEAN